MELELAIKSRALAVKRISKRGSVAPNSMISMLVIELSKISRCTWTMNKMSFLKMSLFIRTS